MPTVNWMWIGNRPLLDNSSGTNATQSQANGAVGWQANGPTEMGAAPVTGNVVGSTSDGTPFFGTTYQSPATSQFSYTRPVTNVAVTGMRIRTFLQAEIEIRIPDYNGGYTTETHTAVMVQMNNGDVFFRPAQGFVSNWDHIDAIMGIEVKSVSLIPNTTYVNAVIQFNPGIYELPIICFGRGTLIETEHGPLEVENLRPGVRIRTRDHGMQVLRWIGSRRLTSGALTRAPNFRPIRIRAGALGQGLPTQDLILSPQHRVLVRSKIAHRMFGAAEVLVAAKQLLQCDGFEIAEDLPEIEYFHMLFDQHEIVISNGAESESLYTGKEALKSVGPNALGEIFALFPELCDEDHIPVPAYPLLTGSQGRRLAQRHVQNTRALVSV